MKFIEEIELSVFDNILQEETLLHFATVEEAKAEGDKLLQGQIRAKASICHTRYWVDDKYQVVKGKPDVCYSKCADMINGVDPEWEMEVEEIAA
jgi:hypothetical protein